MKFIHTQRDIQRNTLIVKGLALTRINPGKQRDPKRIKILKLSVLSSLLVDVCQGHGWRCFPNISKRVTTTLNIAAQAS